MKYGTRYRVPDELLESWPELVRDEGIRVDTNSPRSREGHIVGSVHEGDSRIAILPTVIPESPREHDRSSDSGAFLDVLYSREDRDLPLAERLKKILVRNGAQVVDPARVDRS